MKRFLQTLLHQTANFHDDENGSGAMELVLLVPVLSTICFGLITYAGGFQAKTEAVRATTVITDLISRETNPITPVYLTGISGLLDNLVASDETPEFRLTMFTWSQNTGKFVVSWSKANGMRSPMDTTALNGVSSKLPTIKNGQRAILVETWVDFTPITNVGLEGGTTFANFLVAAPRFVPQLCWAESEDADPTEAEC